jgi:hypothetical protein
MKYDIRAMKAAIHEVQPVLRGMKSTLRECQRQNGGVSSAHSDLRRAKYDASLLYMARSSIRSKLHCKNWGTKPLTLEWQAELAKAVLKVFELPEEPAVIQAAPTEQHAAA